MQWIGWGGEKFESLLEFLVTGVFSMEDRHRTKSQIILTGDERAEQGTDGSRGVHTSER